VREYFLLSYFTFLYLGASSEGRQVMWLIIFSISSSYNLLLDIAHFFRSIEFAYVDRKEFYELERM
jgi:hypothetical protein